MAEDKDEEKGQEGVLPTYTRSKRESKQSSALPADGSRSKPQPRGYSGKDWAKKKSDFIRAASRTGSPDAFVKLVSTWESMEKQKVTDYMKNALTLSQMGRPNAAASQLEAVGAFMSSGYRGEVNAGPDGSFMVKNYDSRGEMVGGYALKPENIAEIALAYQDTGDFLDWKSKDDARDERTAIKADRGRAYAKNQLSKMRYNDLKATEKALDVALKKKTFDYEVAQSEAEASKAQYEAKSAGVALCRMMGQQPLTGQLTALSIILTKTGTFA